MRGRDGAVASKKAGGGALEGEFEVELEGADARGQLALLVTEGEADLDYLQKVDVAAQRLVVKVGGRLEGANGTRDDPRELCVLPKDTWRGSGKHERRAPYGDAWMARSSLRRSRMRQVGRAAADHGDIRVVHDGLTDRDELGVDVLGPHITVMGGCHWPDVQPRPTAPAQRPLAGGAHACLQRRGINCAQRDYMRNPPAVVSTTTVTQPWATASTP